MPVTLTDLAKAAGVSVSTVSRALTNSDHAVNKETRARILRLARELGYRPNLLARGLRSERTFTVGVIVDNISSPFAPPTVRGVQDTLKPAGYSVIITNSDWDPDVEAESIQSFLARPVDGIIFVDTWLHAAREGAPRLDKPHVFINRLFRAGECNCIGPDDEFGARLAVEHLIGLGHRRIALINGPPGWEASIKRLAGYHQALIDHRIALEASLIRSGNWEVQDGYDVARSLFEAPERPSAIFAANDFMAIGAIYALQDMGVRVPQDVAVVGYDDREIASLVRPALSTVTLPCYQMGEAAARLLLGQFAGESSQVGGVQVRGELIIRESCGTPPTSGRSERYWRRTTPRQLLYTTAEPTFATTMDEGR